MSGARAAVRRSILLAVAPLLLSCEGGELATAVVRSEPFVDRVRAEGHLVAVESTVVGVPSQVRQRARIAWMADDGTRVGEGDAVLRFDAREMQQNLENARGDLDRSGHERDRTEADSRSRRQELEKNATMADLELEVSEKYQYQDDQVFARNEIIESRIDGDLARTRKEHAQEVGGIRSRLSETETELVDISSDLARQRIREAEEGLDALEVKAPHAGLLIWNRDWRGEPPRVGEEVWRGRELGSLPRLDRMNAQVYVLEADAGGIEPGARAVLSVDARPDVTLAAKVVSIDAVSEPRFRGSPVRYFGVTLEPEGTDPSFMKPGQRVSALIWVEDRPEALVVPRQAVQRDHDGSWVWRRNGDAFERREVELGPQSVALAVIEEGLEEGDRVALEDPEAAAGPDEPMPGQPGTSTATPTGFGG